MAKRPRLFYGDKEVKTLKIVYGSEEKECFDVVDGNNKKIYHKHHGTSGNGCYTKRVEYQASCGNSLYRGQGGYIDEPCNSSSFSYNSSTGNWGCNKCGRNWGTSHPSVCTDTWYHWTDYYYCSQHGRQSRNPGSCGASVTRVRYDLGCGYE